MGTVDHHDLSERARAILRAIVHLYILHAAPVGSRFVSRYLEREFKLSPASIRNIMADLEEAGYITHPHTSAGRMPTDRGYRVYVDTMMEYERLSREETEAVVQNLLATPREAVLREASRMLGSLSHHIALVRMPQLRDARVHRVEMLPLSSQRVLVIIALESDIVRTISIETHHVPTSATLDEITRVINERVTGRPLSVITEIVSTIAADAAEEGRDLIRLFIDHVGTINDGTHHLLTLPEFDRPDRVRSVIELVENEEVIVHLLDTVEGGAGVRVRIGNEMPDSSLQDYSLITTTYRVGAATGTVGVIGPKRMNYSRMVSLVDFVSDVLSSSFDGRAS
jgi:heat-inducible transcriptional repressor